MVGSVGVYTIHEDLSKALDQLGVKLTYISAGKFKVDGNDAEPLSDTARAHMQGIVDAMYSRFVGDVALGRGVTPTAVANGYGQGEAVTADEALSLHMVDRIATLDDTVNRALTTPPSLTAAARARALTPAPAVLDTPQEPARATGQDRRRAVVQLETQFLEHLFHP
jgi:ClpP class serine protease